MRTNLTPSTPTLQRHPRSSDGSAHIGTAHLTPTGIDRPLPHLLPADLRTGRWAEAGPASNHAPRVSSSTGDGSERSVLAATTARGMVRGILSDVGMTIHQLAPLHHLLRKRAIGYPASAFKVGNRPTAASDVSYPREDVRRSLAVGGVVAMPAFE